MLVQSIADLETTTDELNMELVGLEEDDGGGKRLHLAFVYNIFWFVRASCQ